MLGSTCRSLMSAQGLPWRKTQAMEAVAGQDCVTASFPGTCGQHQGPQGPSPLPRVAFRDPRPSLVCASPAGINTHRLTWPKSKSDLPRLTTSVPRCLKVRTLEGFVQSYGSPVLRKAGKVLGDRRWRLESTAGGWWKATLGVVTCSHQRAPHSSFTATLVSSGGLSQSRHLGNCSRAQTPQFPAG